MDADDLTADDRRILDVLAEGQASSNFVSWRTDLSEEAVTERLETLADDGHVAGDGEMWELVDDPRE